LAWLLAAPALPLVAPAPASASDEWNRLGPELHAAVSAMAKTVRRSREAIEL
jgi:hypothetical protein